MFSLSAKIPKRAITFFFSSKLILIPLVHGADQKGYGENEIDVQYSSNRRENFCYLGH